MPSFVSPVDDIHNLYIQQLPSGRPVKIEKAVRIDGITVLAAENGILYTNHLKNYCYLSGVYPWMEPLMKCLVRLGAITKEQMQEHMELCERRDKEKSLGYDKDTFLRLQKEYGFKITKEQQRIFGTPTPASEEG